MFGFRRRKLSVVVVVYRMVREAPRTLYSLSTAYQEGVTEDDYEVIVVENPSDRMLSPGMVRRHGRQFRYVVNLRNPESPSAALNRGARHARGQHLMLMIDGARIASPGIVARTLDALKLYDRAVVATLGWHLGPDNQARSIHQGYCQEVEDQNLAQADWTANGYRLFEISALAGSSAGGWFAPILESNCITVSREHCRELGGYSEAFGSPGGGFVNLDFYDRAVDDSSRPTILLLGEGTFHQVHGGVATNRINDEPIRRYQEEYQRVRGRSFAAPQIQPIFFGHMPAEAKPVMRQSMHHARNVSRRKFPSIAPVGLPEPAVSSRRPRVLAVLGMHRSGTSCLAGTLMECGVHFGDVSRKNPHNHKGNNENRRIMDLHDRVLDDNGGSWSSPPADVQWSDDHRSIRDAIIEEYERTGQPWWGFKDPRALLALEGWLERLPDVNLVGIFRHPDAVAQSLTNRNQFTRRQGLALWYEYNRRLLDFHQRRPFPILFFTNEVNAFRDQLDRLTKRLQIGSPRGGFEFFEPSLQHCAAEKSRRLPQDVADLYRRLHDVAGAAAPIPQDGVKRAAA